MYKKMAATLLLLLSLFFCCYADFNDPDRIAEEQGYLVREHSLGRPFQGRGTEVRVVLHGSLCAHSFYCYCISISRVYNVVVVHTMYCIIVYVCRFRSGSSVGPQC